MTATEIGMWISYAFILFLILTRPTIEDIADQLLSKEEGLERELVEVIRKELKLRDDNIRDIAEKAIAQNIAFKASMDEEFINRLVEKVKREME